MSSWYEALPQNFFLGVGVFALVVLLVIIAKQYERSATPAAIVKKGASLVRKCADSTFEAQETQNPLVAFSKVTEAKAYLNVAQTLANQSELTHEAQVAVADLEAELEKEEMRAKQKLMQLCPQVAGVARVGTPSSLTDKHFTRFDDKIKSNS